MDFVELKISCNSGFKEILIAEVGELGYDSMIETDQGFNAYIEEEQYDKLTIEKLQEQYGSLSDLKWETVRIKRKNWNKEWESNFDPVIIDHTCGIRATFHKPLADVEQEIIINPRMSFGTGHHETTKLMIKALLGENPNGKSVLDCGCGTGVLSILASKLGAISVTGFDTDEWAVENSVENSALNAIEDINFWTGTIADLDTENHYNLILANINKNILLQEISSYDEHLDTNGRLILSGFYNTDLEEIKETASHSGLIFDYSNEINNWVSAAFLKK